MSKLPTRKIQIFEHGKLYLFEFPMNYNIEICEKIGKRAINKYLSNENKTLRECKDESQKEIFQEFYLR